VTWIEFQVLCISKRVIKCIHGSIFQAWIPVPEDRTARIFIGRTDTSWDSQIEYRVERGAPRRKFWSGIDALNSTLTSTGTLCQLLPIQESCLNADCSCTALARSIRSTESQTTLQQCLDINLVLIAVLFCFLLVLPYWKLLGTSQPPPMRDAYSTDGDRRTRIAGACTNMWILVNLFNSFSYRLVVVNYSIY
jgi:hypothetical protein